jgi:predicted phage baseplate assembly protein
MSCDHDCDKPAAFPKTISNRPGLPQIDYRIGAYAELRERMLHLLNQDPALSAWTHRGADDPGIALLEGTAVVGDILTFYQQLYANERYLRTAQWRESVAELVRLLGYRLTPGVGGEASFALAVKGTEPVVVPKGFGLKADLEGGSKPAEFESTQELTAYPQLSVFSLYRPRQTPSATNGTQIFKVQAAGIPEGLEFAEGDRVLLGDPEPGMSDPARIENAQILTVESSWQAFDTLHVKFTTPLKWSGSIYTLKAYKLGESYRHFGHNAPIKTVTPSGSSYTTTSTNYIRSVNGNTTVPDPNLGAKQMPLDAEVKNFSVGAHVIVQTRLRPSANATSATRYTLVRKIDEVESGSYTWGMVSGASTMLRLDTKLTTDGNTHADIRSFTFHEVIGEPFRLRAQEQPTSASSGNYLDYYGTDAQAQALLGRDLLLTGPADAVRNAAVTEVQSLDASSAERNLFRRLTLDQSLSYADFPIDTPIVTVYGNLVPATQGKTQKEVVLGSGDKRQRFQTFPLPAAPLTYLLDETQTPSQVPELTVYVEGIAWTQVDSFFNCGPDDPVYIVRQDEDEKSYVQFGDNKTGRTLPSGLNNVTAIFRVGNAANGVLKDGATPSISGKLRNFDKLYLPGAVTIGSAAEDGENARVAAPGKMQSLGRMVSLADVEAEALALPHVLKVRAAWSAPEGFPLVRLTVLTQSGAAADLDAVRESMRTYNRCRGPARYPIEVVQGVRQYVYLHIEAGFEAARREADVASAIKRALGLTGEEGNGIDGEEGLFGLRSRQFGQNAHKSQIIAAAQNAPGVTWVALKGAKNLNLGSPPETDPLALTLPSIEVVHSALACPSSRILVLHSAHLVLSLAKDENAQECSA